jgi:glutamate-1-semialdehyde 2,1-aminomutase
MTSKPSNEAGHPSSLLPAALTGPSRSGATPRVIARAEGARLFDTEDRAYIDYSLGSGTLLLGHAHREVSRAVKEQTDRGTNYRFVDGVAIELAERLVASVPCVEHVALTASGSDAAALAMRLARAHHRRDGILKFEGAAHGNSDYGLMSNHLSYVIGDYPRPVPNSAGIPRAVEDCVMVAPFNDFETTAQLIEQQHEELAAVLVEPVQRAIRPASGFLEELRRLTTRHDLLLIFDESTTGFRAGPGGAQDTYGVVPDLCVLGPSISGGLSLGIVGGRADVLGLINPARYGHGDYVFQPASCGASAPACAAAVATLDVLSGTDARATIHASGERLAAGIRSAFGDRGIDIQVSGDHGVIGIWFCPDEVSNFQSALLADSALSQRLSDDLLERGVIFDNDLLFVSAAHGDTEIDATLSALADVAAAIAGD